MKKIVSVILSILILVASSGFTISSHICDGKLDEVALSLANKDIDCGMQVKNHSHAAKSNDVNKACCENTFQPVQLDEKYISPKISLNSSLVNYAILKYTILKELFPVSTETAILFTNYSPPPLIRDIPILVESFLI